MGKSIRLSKHSRFTLSWRVKHTTSLNKALMMLVVLTLLMQVCVFMDLSAALFSQDYTGDIVWDTHGSAPDAAEGVTGKLSHFLPWGRVGCFQTMLLVHSMGQISTDSLSQDIVD